MHYNFFLSSEQHGHTETMNTMIRVKAAGQSISDLHTSDSLNKAAADRIDESFLTAHILTGHSWKNHRWHQ